MLTREVAVGFPSDGQSRYVRFTISCQISSTLRSSSMVLITHAYSRGPSIPNTSSVSGMFVSGPASWYYRNNLFPKIPGADDGVSVYEILEVPDGNEAMLFPIHDRCLELLQRLCEHRTKQICPSSSQDKVPTTLEAFCHALCRRRERNQAPDLIVANYYYGKSGGLEWEHDYYGARQFWADEWETEPGWEVRGN